MLPRTKFGRLSESTEKYLRSACRRIERLVNRKDSDTSSTWTTTVLLLLSLRDEVTKVSISTAVEHDATMQVQDLPERAEMIVVVAAEDEEALAIEVEEEEGALIVEVEEAAVALEAIEAVEETGAVEDSEGEAVRIPAGQLVESPSEAALLFPVLARR